MLSHYRLSFWLGLCFLIGFVFYYGLGFYGLADNNEGLYAEIAREMYVSHDYVISTLNGVPYIEKPPLLYWLITGCFHVFGISEFVARLVPATCGAITCIALVFFSKQINRLHEGMLAALILSTSLGFVLIARIVFFDMLLTAMLSLSLMCFYLAWYYLKDKQLSKGIWYQRTAYALLGLAMLAKGIVALALVPLIVSAFLLCTSTFRANFKFFLDPGSIVILLLIVLPWHIFAALQHPGFFQDFIVNEQLLRFLDKRIPHDYYGGPFYYYLPRVIVYLLPWGLLLPLLGLKKYRENSVKDPLKLFAWLWFLIPLIFFSVSKAKAHYYMVVACPALALLLANALVSDFAKQQWVKFWTYIIVIFSVLSLSTVAVAAHLAKKYESYFSSKPIARFLINNDPLIRKKTIFFYQNFERISSLRFYLDQPIKMVDSHSKDLWYGSRFSKNSFLTVQEFDKSTKSNNFYIVVREKELPKFYQKLPHRRFYVKGVFSGWAVLSGS